MSLSQATLIVDETGNGEGEEDGEDGGDAPEILEMDSDVAYMAPLLRFVATLHMLTAFAMMVAYYCLKVGICKVIVEHLLHLSYC